MDAADELDDTELAMDISADLIDPNSTSSPISIIPSSSSSSELV